MASLSLDSIAIDCPDPIALSRFYADLLGVENRGDFVLLPGDAVEIWFQPVEGYQPPTWPSQERGQQVHLEMVTNDVEAAARHAEAVGASRASYQPGEGEWVVMLDPAGHPFCLTIPFDNVPLPPHSELDVWIALAAITFDCPDGEQLWSFYRQVAELQPQDVKGMAPALVAETGIMLLVQKVDTYQAPTWPSQERGQQMHIDFHTNDRSAHVARATELGAEVVDVQGSFTVMKDPAGHPFCICDEQ